MSLFWSSADLTGNQTHVDALAPRPRFWSSADLTGNQTVRADPEPLLEFWSSADLTGNQTDLQKFTNEKGFGAVPI